VVKPVVELVVKLKRLLVGGVHVLVVDSKTRLYFIDGRGVCWFDKSAQSAGVLIFFVVSFSPIVFTSKILNNIYI
jgi:hypothetical protein